MTTLYSAPVDANFRLMPRKVFKEHAAPFKNFIDKDCGITKDVFVEDGKRRIPRGRGQPSTSRNTSFEKLAADAAAKALRKAEEEAQKSGVFVVDIENSSLFEEDLNWKEPREEYPGLRDPQRVRKMYIAACDMLGIVASNRFLRGVQSGRVVAGYQGFGPLGARAVAISLVTGLTVTELHIPGNMLGAQGVYFMAKLIHGNYVIKVLDLCDNNLGREGAKVLANAIKENHSLQEIRAAGNKFDDKTGAYFGDAIQVNTQIKQLDLSRNMLSMDGAIAIGKAMEINDAIIHLDLSYNHLRAKGIKGLAKMLAKNTGLLNLDISRNGVGTDGARLLGEGLSHNNKLAVLAVNGCRLNVEGLITFLGKMKKNKCLKSLQIAENPITNADLCLFIKAINSVPDICLSFIDASSVMVSQECLDLIKQVGVARPGFMVTYRGLLSIEDQSKHMLDTLNLHGGDPLEALINYTKTKNLRLVDLFSSFDQDKNGTITRQELIRGVAAAGIPLSIKQMDKLVAKLDQDGDGEIDFAELLDGYKRFMRSQHKKALLARSRPKTDNDAFPGRTGEGAEDPANVAETPAVRIRGSRIFSRPSTRQQSQQYEQPLISRTPSRQQSQLNEQPLISRTPSRQQSQLNEQQLISNRRAVDVTVGETGDDTGDTPVV